MVHVRRLLAVFFALVMAFAASVLAAGYFFADGAQWLDYIRIALLAISTAWLAWGAGLALIGLLWQPENILNTTGDFQDKRTAVLIPIYNEEPSKTFSHVAAMVASIKQQGHGHVFDFAILSDTNSVSVAEQEELWFLRLKQEVGQACNIFYRRRALNTGKKAGNIADFIKTSGARYEYLIILDADSLMEASTMEQMVLRMEADPSLGLLQTLPKIINARSFFGRAIQFSASYYSPVYATGVAALQGDEGPFWGHNAITRTRAFAQSCGLPILPGKPPLGGHILSHDYVEAALLARNGWKVQLDPNLLGSYEEGPDNVIDYAKRDRRWCQGNLQHSKIVTAPGLKLWSRFTFLQGIMAYLSAPIWALFLIASIVAPHIQVIPDYFPTPGIPVFPRVMQENALALLTGVLGLLLGPKLLIFLQAIISDRNRYYGGSMWTFLGITTEILSSSVLAPILMLFQTRSVLQVLLGADGGWPSANREAGKVSLSEAWSASWWVVITGLTILSITYWLESDYIAYLLLITLPQIFAPLIISLTSNVMGGKATRRLFLTLEERTPTSVIALQQAILLRWRGEDLEQTLAPVLEQGAGFETAETI